MNVMNDETMDLAEDAQEKLLASLKSVTSSSNLGKIREHDDNEDWMGGADPANTSGRVDPYDWMEEDDDDEEEDYKEEEVDMYTLSDDDDDDDEQGDTFAMMDGITTTTTTTVPTSTPKRRVLHRADTPVISNTKKVRTQENRSAIADRLIVKRSLPSVYSTHEEFRQYHQALEHWLGESGHRDEGDEDSQLQFLNTLNQTCWRDESSKKEGNFWLLLRFLQEVGGVDAVVWDDSLDHSEAIATYTADIAQRTWLAPATIVKACYDQDEAPTALCRRHTILRWLEACFKHDLPADVYRQYRAKPIGRDLQGMYTTNRDKEILHNSLALLLAGQWDEARRLARKAGVGWRSAVWGGGYAHDGGTGGGGNPQRALWRRMLWIRAERPFQNSDESTITALLSSHLLQAFSNTTSLNTWEKNLYAALRCGWDRLEDAVLHEHNNHRRQLRPPYPGTELENFERDHLEATINLAGMDEKEAVDLIESVPEESMKARDPILKATERFLVGKSSISSLLQASEYWESSAELLRFATHLSIYLSFLPNTVPGTVEWKNHLVLEYLKFLSSREDLWYMMVMYASLLPEDTIIEELPILLTVIESPSERGVILDQMKQFLTARPFLANDVLIRTISLVINSEASPDEDFEEMDERKMSAILWLCHDPDHAADAMIATNALLRQFLLNDKLVSATELVDSVVPSNLVETVFSIMDESTVTDEAAKFAYSEYQAFTAYLHAMSSREDFQEKITATAVPVLPILDKAQLNVTESSIARAAEHRALMEATRTALSQIAVAAEDVLELLRSVLKHPGGFLMPDPMESNNTLSGVTNDNAERIQEMNTLRKRLLPEVIQSYHEVCTQTANAVLRLLRDACGNETLGEVVQELDEMGTSSSPMTPLYWAQQALLLHNILINDSFCIQPDPPVVAELAVQATLLCGEYESVLSTKVLPPQSPEYL